MATFYIPCFLLIIFLQLQAVFAGNNTNSKCFFSPRTRSKETCYGQLNICDVTLARAGGIPQGTKVCMFHKNKIVWSDTNRCSCPSTWGHSKTLHRHPIPKRMFNILDKAGENVDGYRPGTRWCNKCQQNAELELTGKRETPSKRRKVRSHNPLFNS